MENKELLLKLLLDKKSPEKKGKPLLIIDASKINKKEEQVLKELFEAITLLDINFNIIKKADTAGEKKLFKLADTILVLNPESKLFKEALKSGVVPIILKTPKLTLKEYDLLSEQGVCFCFENINKWEIFAAIVRAFESYKFPYDWKNIVRQILY